jgi:hypothetical protein
MISGHAYGEYDQKVPSPLGNILAAGPAQIEEQWGNKKNM